MRTDKELEDLIYKAQQGVCFITSGEIGEDLNPRKTDIDIANIISSISSKEIKTKLFAYKLIDDDTKERGIYPLTLAGIRFKSFKDEDKKAALNERKLKKDTEHFLKDQKFGYPF